MTSWRHRLIGDFTWRRLLISLVEIYLGVLLWAWFFSDRIAFQPPPPTYTAGAGVYCIPAADEQPLAVLALTNNGPAMAVLYVHGNAEDLGGVRFLLEAYREASFDVYSFDYRGYGLSGGKPGTRRAYEDIEQVYQHLVHERGVSPGRLIVHGRSLGAAVALHLATRRPVAGAIIESPFVTAFRAQTQIPLSPIDKMRNDWEIRRLRCPVLVIHGEQDQVIPSWHGKRLYELAPEPKFHYWIAQAGHNDVPAVNEVDYFRRLQDFRDFVLQHQNTAAASSQGASWSSILVRAINLQELIRPVAAWERSLHFSSSAATNKAMLASLAPKITGDMDHGFFLKVEEHSDGVDATLAETQGPGMISWVWSANPVGTIRLFIDDDTTPTLEMPFQKFLTGAFLPFPGPFATLTALGYNLHFPLLHEKSCRLVLRVREKKDLASLYYQVAWNAIDPSQPIHRFSTTDVSQGKPQLKELAETLEQTMDGQSAEPLLTKDIPAGAVVELYASDQAGTLTSIVLQADTKTDLASLELLAYWDGEESPSMDCPLPLLAGVSEAMEEVRSLPVTLRGSQLILRWPMPYRSVRLAIRNRNTIPVRLSYAVQSGPSTGQLRLKGQHRRHEHLRTEQHNILTLADLPGPGRIAACNLQVTSRSRSWWGEGDQLIYLDDLSRPAWQGTGTEDYFGFAWCAQTPFDHPFRGQASVSDTPRGRAIALHRYHFLDSLPFHQQARFDTEAWGLAEGFMDYESLILYYTGTH